MEPWPCYPLGLHDLRGTPGLPASVSPFVTGTIPQGSRGPRTPPICDCGRVPPGQALGARGWRGKAPGCDLPLSAHPQVPSVSCCPSPSSSARVWAAGQPRPSGPPSSTTRPSSSSSSSAGRLRRLPTSASSQSSPPTTTRRWSSRPSGAASVRAPRALLRSGCAALGRWAPAHAPVKAY